MAKVKELWHQQMLQGKTKAAKEKDLQQQTRKKRERWRPWAMSAELDSIRKWERRQTGRSEFEDSELGDAYGAREPVVSQQQVILQPPVERKVNIHNENHNIGWCAIRIRYMYYNHRENWLHACRSATMALYQDP